jgi:alkylation response protein AidB-like acyl-CoA dehydrogenase
MTAASTSVLTQPLLDRCRERAPGHDRHNTFCLEDFNELKAAGYLKMAIPKEFGGLGMTLAQVSRETRRPPRSASTCTTTGSATRRTCGAGATNPASGSSKMQRPAMYSRRATPNTATTSRGCSPRRKRSASTAATSGRRRHVRRWIFHVGAR